MSTKIIVSYDGSSNDDDALALGRVFARAGASLALAYVRHSREFDTRREELAQHDAERRLEQGAAWLGDPEIPRHIVVSASTGEGLAQLAESEGASAIVFGSDYRTPPGRVEPGTSAQHLLEGGPVAIAVAPAGLRTATIKSITVSAPDADTAAQQTADALAEKIGASIAAEDGNASNLIVVGSPSSAPPGRIGLSGAARSHLDSARGAVLVVPQGKPLLF
jgi:nucleotide-binding universal stress UspA family protein